MSETICPPFTFVKGGVYYFSRRIPKELKSHYLAQATTKDHRLFKPVQLSLTL